MAFSESLAAPLTVVLRAAEEAGEPAVNPWFIGGGVLLILLILLTGVVAFGGGRDHS